MIKTNALLHVANSQNLAPNSCFFTYHIAITRRSNQLIIRVNLIRRLGDFGEEARFGECNEWANKARRGEKATWRIATKARERTRRLGELVNEA